MIKEEKEIKKFVKKRYAEIASKGGSCSPSCSARIVKQARAIGYTDEEIRSIPPEAAVMGLGCGNPTAVAGLKEGETVLDLGSGGGLDVFLAAQKVEENGHVIGIDMTEEMIEKARQTANQHGYKNVEFRIGEIENLPIEDKSIDVIISNCVINLSSDKLTVFKEAFRVLKSGGRMLISDLVTEGELPEDIKRSFDAWAGCIGGALEKQEYLDTIKKTGFRHVNVVAEHSFGEPGMDDRLKGKIISVKVEVYK